MRPPGTAAAAAGDGDDRPLKSADAAAWLNVPLSTLYHWQSDGIGPRKKRVGKYSMYTLADLRAFLAECEDDS